MKEFFEENRRQLMQLGYIDRQLDEFDRMNERETKEFLRKELIQLGCTDQQLDEFDKQLFKPRWCYSPWDSRSGWFGGMIMGIIIGTIVLLTKLAFIQN